MKYIAVFDVPDETTPIDDTAELVCCGKVSEVYAKVKPYNSTSDLISRGVAINLLNEAQVEYDEYYKGLGKAKTIIDNAPAIAINCKDCDGYEAGYSAGLNDAERPKGDWARHDEWVNGEYVGGFYHVNCPVIEEGYALYSRWETRFCPNCGAPMRKGGVFECHGEQ